MSVNFDSIMADFINESNELLDRAETDILSLEQEGYKDDTINQIFRAIHTIKGNSGLFELGKISSLAHSLESLLNKVRSKEASVDMDLIDLCLSSIDRLREMIRNVSQSEQYEVQDLITSLDEMTARKLEQSSETDSGATTDSAAGKTNGAKPEGDVQKEKDVSSDHTESSGNGNGARKKKNGGFKIPARYLEIAKDSQRYLNVVILEPGTEDTRMLSDLDGGFGSLLDSGDVLSYGVREDRIVPIQENHPAVISYYILMLSDKELTPDFQIGPFTPTGVKVLYRPQNGNREEKSGSSEKEAGETKTKNENLAESNANQPEPEKDPGEGDEVSAMTPEANKNTITEPVNSTGAMTGATEASGAGDATQPEKGESEGGDTHLKVPVKLIDSLINLAGETIIARNELVQKVSTTRDAGLDTVSKKISYLITRLQEGIMRTRLQELNTVFQRIPRIVRDASHGTGKKVELSLTGGEVELDKALIDAIGESIMHIIRNSVDHGVETPEDRIRAGKKPEGRIVVHAQLRGGNVVLLVKDDGRGLNLEQIKQKAITRGTITPEQAATMGPEQIAELVFLPGLSTAEQVSRTSGRGVGMDVVRSNLKKVGGTVEISGEPGKGTTILATLPQTLSIVTSLMISSCNQMYALPQQNVVELILIDKKQLREVEGHDVYELRGHLLPLINLGKTLELRGSDAANPQYIVVVRSERHQFGLLIDEVINLEEIVVKRLGQFFAGLAFFSGAAILGDGESVLILDVPGLARFANLQSNLSDEELDRDKEGEETIATGYLLFNVFGQQFAISVRTVPRIEKITSSDIDIFMGIEVIRYREEVVPVIRLEEIYDLELERDNRNEYYVVIFNNGGMRVGIIASEINNVVEDPGQIDYVTFARESIEGHSILEGTVTLILDAVDLIDRLQRTRFKEIARHIRKLQGNTASDREKELKARAEIKQNVESRESSADADVEVLESENKAEPVAQDPGWNETLNDLKKKVETGEDQTGEPLDQEVGEVEHADAQALAGSESSDPS